MLIKPFFSIMLLSSIILIGLVGCDTRFKAEEILSQYVTDLNRSQFLSIPSTAIVMPVNLPALRDRRRELSSFDISLLDFLSLQQCDVGAVVGRKNSILGKVMSNSQRFLYELDIIRSIESCVIHDDLLSDKLRLIAQSKRLELPIAFGNAIFNGEESKAFFSLSNGFLSLNNSLENQQELLSALYRLVNIGRHLDDLPDIDGNIFENDLKLLMDSEYGGRLLYSLAQITRYLSSIAGEIGDLDERVCGASTVYLKQQFDNHYIKKIQPYMGRISQAAYQVLPMLNELIKLSSPFSLDMVVFLNQFSLKGVDSEWYRYQQASQIHAKKWSLLFESCSVAIK